MHDLRYTGRIARSFSRFAGLSLVVALVACEAPAPDLSTPAESESGAATVPVDLEPPAAAGAFAPRWSLDQGTPLLSWIEPIENGHRLRFSRLVDGVWSEPGIAAEGDDFFANWADTPSVIADGRGHLRAHWLEKTSAETYSYSIALARSEDGGASWQREGFLNDDNTLTEHGFTSTAIGPNDDLLAVWLDGRETAGGGTMTLRAALDGEPSVVLDERVCECCATSVASADSGFVVAYRDRSMEEQRDISIVRATEEGWGEPLLLHDDGWEIDGCPVNGPAISARGDDVAVAWYTGAEEEPRVSIAFSADGGETFSIPAAVDSADPLGRVGVAWTEEQAAVVWLGSFEGGASLYLQGFSPTGVAGPRLEVARTDASRRSGVPVLLAGDSELYVAWIESVGEASLRLRAQVVPHSSLR